MTPAHLAIVGPGLIGTSVALAARRAWPSLLITTVDRDGVLDAVAAADTVVLAAPVDAIAEMVASAARGWRAALVIDTGSTKQAIVATARAAGLANFVGGHPMAGAATSGAAAARADLFDGRPWFLVPADAGSPACARAEALVAALGATPVVMRDDGGEHDRLMAAISHLPQVVAAALMKVAGDAAGERGLAWAGPGLRDTTRLAASAATVWESVLATNAAALRPLLLAVAAELTNVAARLDDRDAVAALFAAANRHRARLD